MSGDFMRLGVFAGSTALLALSFPGNETGAVGLMSNLQVYCHLPHVVNNALYKSSNRLSCGTNIISNNKERALSDEDPLSLDEFTECVKQDGWKKNYSSQLPLSTKATIRKLAFGLKEMDEVTFVYSWSILSTIEVQPNRNEPISIDYKFDSKIKLFFNNNNKEEEEFNASANFAQEIVPGSEVKINTKNGERKLIARAQKTVTIFSTGKDPKRLCKIYLDTFSYAIYTK